MSVNARSRSGAVATSRSQSSVPPEVPLVRARGQGVTLFHPGTDPRLHSGRNSIRQTILSMIPARPQDSDILPPVCGPRMFWGMTANNGMLTVLRIGGFATVSAAGRDATAILARYRSLHPVPVTDPVGGLRSLWLVADGQVELVAGQAWRAGSSRIPTLRQVLRPTAPWDDSSWADARAWEDARMGRKPRTWVQRP